MLDTELKAAGSNISREVLLAFKQPVPLDPNEIIPLLRGDEDHFTPLTVASVTKSGYKHTSREKCDSKTRKALDRLLKSTGERGQTILQMSVALITGLYARIDSGILTNPEEQVAEYRKVIQRLTRLTADLHLGVQRQLVATMFELPRSASLQRRPSAAPLSWAAASKHEAKRNEFATAYSSVSKSLRQGSGIGGSKTDSSSKSSDRRKPKTTAKDRRFKIPKSPARKRKHGKSDDEGSSDDEASDNDVSSDEDVSDASSTEPSNSGPTSKRLFGTPRSGARTPSSSSPRGGKGKESPRADAKAKGKTSGATGGAKSDKKTSQKPHSRDHAKKRLSSGQKRNDSPKPDKPHKKVKFDLDRHDKPKSNGKSNGKSQGKSTDKSTGQSKDKSKSKPNRKQDKHKSGKRNGKAHGKFRHLRN
jgi:hypothetical protein